jgi:putative membrane protein
VVHFLYRIFCGFFLGISIFAPGVSGSIMAVMMGIYDRLLDVVSHPFKNIRENIRYLFPMGIGGLISLVLFVLAFSYLFETYEKATYLLFVGLIAGNLPVVFRDANTDGFKPRYALGILAAFALAVTLGVFSARAPAAQGASLVYLGLCGAVAGVASMVPGMSISMTLMLFGVYDYLMRAAKSVNLPVIAVTGLCFVCAMVLFSRFTKLIFRRYHHFARFTVFGFMCGALVAIFLRLPPDGEGFHWFVGALMILAGLGISLLFVLLGKKIKMTESGEA